MAAPLLFVSVAWLVAGTLCISMWRDEKADSCSSIVNGQKVMSGTKLEYDAWKELGGSNSTWDWDGLYPYMLKVGSGHDA